MIIVQLESLPAASRVSKRHVWRLPQSFMQRDILELLYLRSSWNLSRFVRSAFASASWYSAWGSLRGLDAQAIWQAPKSAANPYAVSQVTKSGRTGYDSWQRARFNKCRAISALWMIALDDCLRSLGKVSEIILLWHVPEMRFLMSFEIIKMGIAYEYAWEIPMTKCPIHLATRHPFQWIQSW